MAIDFEDVAKRGDRDVVYFVKIAYHDSGGTAQTVRWCGPRRKVGSGVVYPDPDAPSGTPRHWEPRLARLVIDHDAGPLRQRVQSVSDLSMTVRATADEALRTDLENGRWDNKTFEAWAVEIDPSVGRPFPTGNYRAIYTGLVDKGPTAISEDRFRIRAAASAVDQGLRWPATRLPDNDTDASALWSDIAVGLPTTKPAAVRFSPQNYGKFVPPVFGDGADQVWKEAIVFGSRATGGGPTYWAHISPQTNCYAHDIYVTDANDQVIAVVNTWGGTLTSQENTTTTEGPTGTNCRFQVPTAYQTLFDPDLHRVMVRVSGPDVGQISTSPDYNSSGAVREEVDEVLEDVFTDSQLLNLADPFADGSLSDFDLNNPFTDADIFKIRASVPLLDDTEGGGDLPLVTDVLGDLMRRLNADLLIRYDSTNEEMRIAPYWRGPQSGASSDHTFYEHHLVSRVPLSLTIDRDPDGVYANRVRMKEGEKFEEPDDTNHIFEVIRSRVTEDEDTAEQGSTKFNGVRETTEAVEHWTHHDQDAADECAADLLAERSQLQLVIEADLGTAAMGVDVGDVAEYSITGVPSAGGMIRALQQDWDALSVGLATYHVEFY